MRRFSNFIRNINYLTKHSLWDQRENDIVYLTNKILDDAQYEFDLTDGGTSKPTILDGDESLDLVLSSGKSFVRTGDGEVKIMMGMDQPFQEYDKELADGLRNLFIQKRENLLVGINRNYYIPGYLRGYAPFYRRFAYDYRQYYKKILREDVTYIDATMTSFQFGMHEDSKTIERYNKWLNAFRDRDVILVCGKGVIDKLEHDVFQFARKKTIIYGPSKHAWREHISLIDKIKQVGDKDAIIVFILGMAGKVMIAELADQGYTCWDAGHLAKYYDAYKRGIENTDKNISDFFAPD